MNLRTQGFLLTLPLAVLPALWIAAQDAPAPSGVYAALYSRGAKWAAGKPTFEQQEIADHVRHHAGLGERRLGAAPFAKDHEDATDPLVGMVIFIAATEAEATDWAVSDPAVVAETLDVRVHPWQVDALRPFPLRR
jgi:hypothetical protein